MTESFLWGTLAASSLVIGAIIALVFRISLRAIGLIMAFGSGVLISAVAFDLVQEAADKSTGHGWAVAGLFAGCLVFFGGDLLIDRLGGGDRKDATGDQETGSPLAIVLGTVLDGIPESMVIGLTIFEGGAVGAAYLAAVFISNLPEAISSTSGLVTSGWKQSRILWMWIAIALISGLASAAGYGLFQDSSPEPVAFARLRGRCDPHHARRDDDARGLRARWQAGRSRHDARIRRRVRNPHAGLSQSNPLASASDLASAATEERDGEGGERGGGRARGDARRVVPGRPGSRVVGGNRSRQSPRLDGVRGRPIADAARLKLHEEAQMAKPMFFYTGIYDNVADADADADADYEAIKSLHKGGSSGHMTRP